MGQGGLITHHPTLRRWLQGTWAPHAAQAQGWFPATGQVLWRQMWSQSSGTSYSPGILTRERKGRGQDCTGEALANLDSLHQSCPPAPECLGLSSRPTVSREGHCKPWEAKSRRPLLGTHSWAQV